MEKEIRPLNPNDLWVGDLIQHCKTGIVGKFEGVKNGKIVLQDGKQSVLGTPTDFILVDEAVEIADELTDADIDNRDPDLTEGTELDLHIAALDESRVGENPILIRNFQLRKCREFIAQAIEQRLHSVIIIHGKGAGVLELPRELLVIKYGMEP